MKNIKYKRQINASLWNNLSVGIHSKWFTQMHESKVGKEHDAVLYIPPKRMNTFLSNDDPTDERLQRKFHMPMHANAFQFNKCASHVHEWNMG